MSFSIRNWGVDYVIVGLVPENLRGNISKGFVMGFYEKGDLKVFFMFLFKVEVFILRLVCTSPKTCTVPEDRTIILSGFETEIGLVVRLLYVL